MSREQFIADHPIERELVERGVRLIGGGFKKTAKCPFHEDGSPSFSVDTEKGLWHCFGGCGGGSVIDLIAMFENMNPSSVLKMFGSKDYERTPAQFQGGDSKAEKVKPVIDKIYSYQNALGVEVYQAIRMRPKSFRQRHPDGKGGWVWTMEGVERVLYRLPEIIKSETVAICEGEKDAENITSLGFCGTCNVGGAGKWLDGYTESITGKDVLIFGDNDKAGLDHVNLVFESIAGKARTVKIIKFSNVHKDITEYIESFKTKEEAKAAIESLVEDSHPFLKGVSLPIFTIAEMEGRYQKHVLNSEHDSLDLGKWLPKLGKKVRRLMPGELVLMMGDTGTGKTALLSNLARACKPLPTLMFELELPGELLFERFVAAEMQMACKEVESEYKKGSGAGQEVLSKAFPHLFLCWESRQTIENLEHLIHRAELKIGERPKVVILDYVQLLKGKGSNRRERIANIAEDLKVIAKTTRTIIVIASQVSRPNSDDPEITLHDAKEAGELENSSGLVLGAWRDPEDKKKLHLKILKNTKGYAGDEILCDFDGATMRITQSTGISDEDVPKEEKKKDDPRNPHAD